MSVEIFWDDTPKTIIRQVLVDRLSAEEYYEAMEHMADFLERVHHRVDVIIQFDGYDSSRSYSFLSGILSQLGEQPPNVGVMVLVVPKKMRDHLSNRTVSKINRVDCALVDNLHHAYTFIENYHQQSASV